MEKEPGCIHDRDANGLFLCSFIPNREGVDLQAGFSLLHAEGSPATTHKPKRRPPTGELHYQRNEEANATYHTLLRSELFANEIPQSVPAHLTARTPTSDTGSRERAHTPPPTTGGGAGSVTPSTPSKNLFTYMSPQTRTPHARTIRTDTRAEIYSLSPIRFDSQRMLLSPRKTTRQVSKIPYKVLDAPDLKDDFYLNLVDWGSSGVLGVGLGSSVYMWNSMTGRVDELLNLGPSDHVTSVSWIQRGSQLAVGTHKGLVQIWDASRGKKLRTMTGHTQRVGALAWNAHILTSGSRDRTIYHRDVRVRNQYTHTLRGHKQEVCGLRWSDEGQLASGGNDNKVFIWPGVEETPLWRFTEHRAAVKALSWSPHQRGLLASGGGTADRRICFWNTTTGALISSLDTGSQVCNLRWSTLSNELVSTHGYSENQIVVWKYPSMQQVVSLTGHTYRVLYLAMSPDGQVIVTGAGDETLRFWNCFQKRNGGGSGGVLDGWAEIR